jgi:hypothetical protein
MVYVSGVSRRIGLCRKEAIFALCGLVASPSCKSKGTQPPVDKADSTAAAATSRSVVRDAAPSEAVFSAPIAAVRARCGDVVAGLVAAESLLRVVAMEGPERWTVDLARGVGWAPDAELNLLVADDGVALVWKGFAGKPGKMIALLGPHGEARGEPFGIGASVCTTLDGIAWIDPGRVGPTRVRARRWRETEDHKAVAVSSDRAPSLVCGDHAVFVLGDGDEDLIATSLVPGEPARPTVAVLRDSDFGEDEEREHDTYSVGDDLGLVRIGESGAIAIRELRQGGVATGWRRLKHVLSADDDVVAVDGDAHATFVAYTHEADEPCVGVGSTAERVQALRFDRESGDESVIDLAPPDCDRPRGPFWVGSASGTPVVAWVERNGKTAPKTPSIRGLGARLLRPDGARPGGVDIAADALANGGCDTTSCVFAALIRGADGDDRRPGPIVIVNYP